MKEFARYVAHLKSILRRKGRTEQDADDLVQEAFIRLEVYRREHHVAEPEAFLVRTALNLSVDAHRRSRTHPEEALSEEHDILDAAPRPDEVLAARQRLDRLSAGLNEISQRSREIFLAHRLEGRSYAVIADDQGITVSAVEKHIAKTALFLVKWMKGW